MKREPNDPGFDRIVRAAVKHDFPVNVLFWGNVDAGTALIDRHPDTRFIIDHLAIMQPSVLPVAVSMNFGPLVLTNIGPPPGSICYAGPGRA